MPSEWIVTVGLYLNGWTLMLHLKAMLSEIEAAGDRSLLVLGYRKDNYENKNGGATKPVLCCRPIEYHFEKNAVRLLANMVCMAERR